MFISVPILGDDGEVFFALGFFGVFSIFQMYVNFGLLAMAVMVAVSLVFRAHPFAFGWGSVLDNLFVSIYPTIKPMAWEHCTLHPMKIPKRGLFKLRHCMIYEDEEILSSISEWLLDLKVGAENLPTVHSTAGIQTGAPRA